MIRVGLYSRDSTLGSMLSAALGDEFQFLPGAMECGIDRALDSRECSVVLLDLNSHRESVDEIHKLERSLMGSKAAWIVMADDELRATAAEMVRLGAYAYCRRPLSLRDLGAILRQAHENASIRQRPSHTEVRQTSTADWNGIVGSSRQIQHLCHLIDAVANNSASVLVTGASGTGKELVARAIHSRGVRAGRPFVTVPCGAIPETLIESELFGHEKGAFTGSVGCRQGYFEQAQDGTLFLDEIGELSLYTQVKLLRVLQQREFSRLGSSKLTALRARVIVATHRDLDDMVAKGRFRQDLYYRVNVMRIETPALEDHAEDIPQIAVYFLRRYAKLYQRPVVGIDLRAMEALRNYSWPGNVRELENVIQRALIVAHGDLLRFEDLPADLSENEKGKPASVEEFSGGSFEHQLRKYKIRLAATAIREHKGSKTQAARSLHISRAYLHRLIRSSEADVDYERERKAVGQ